ncbi:hypothetical protein Naga_100280g10 [Nannochloropsis gaditana]|uniref:Uncharacterized protein n=1 Tax=Nannochloropsis gaditana TaxID=72520 RepID=W7TTW9_9STRA|nr:hypothetical protein Naga_100280g10 [Nannochloropsis gaditana]
MELGLRFRHWGLSPAEVRLALYAALLLPLANLRYREKTGKKLNLNLNKKPLEVSRYVFARMLKMKAKDADKLILLHQVVDGFVPFLEEGKKGRREGGKEGGMEARLKREQIGGLMLQGGSGGEGRDRGEGRVRGEGEGEGKFSYRQAALQVSDYIQSAGLSEIYLQAPPLDGEGLRRVLPGIPHGPPFRLVMDAQVGIWLREPEEGRRGGLYIRRSRRLDLPKTLNGLDTTKERRKQYGSTSDNSDRLIFPASDSLCCLSSLAEK